ncbi:MAG TPA: MlaD family protein [Kiritimatiellia bacterium]|nr:MlaD family protein [Kiritimatiellia bacterium]
MKKSRMQETSIEVTVGAFMFMILLALGFFTIVLSRENVFRKNYSVVVVFQDVRGLREGDNVFVRGVDVGKIKTLQIEPSGVRVGVTLDQEVVVHEDYSVEILPSSVLGGRFLNINVGSSDKPVVASGSVLQGKMPADLIDEATRAAKLIREALEEGGIIENLKTSMAQIKEITTKLNEGEGTIGKLLTDRKVYDDISEITANLKDVSQRLGEGKGTLGKLLSEDDTLYNDLSAAAASIREITDQIAKGEGTLGKLTKDDELYQEAKLLLNELRATIDDYRETAPITTFTSIFFGAF